MGGLWKLRRICLFVSVSNGNGVDH
uniref:Uncharacterized protein n=1 Tax=Rhizophora mucronata TaxID=61149 RepID=A0A2P2PF84_RHIMU